MAISKIILNGVTQMDLTGDTVDADKLLSSYTAHKNDGTQVIGTASVSPTLQSKTNINPTTSSQTITADNGYDGLSSVQINAMPSGSATPASSISATGATVTTGTNTLTLSKIVSNTPQVSAGYVASGTAGNSAVSLSANVTTKAAATIYPSTSDQTIASGTYLTGTQTIKGITVSGLSAGNIASGVTVKIGDSADDDRVMSVTGTLAFQTIYSGSGTPSSSTGVNGDVYIQTS